MGIENAVDFRLVSQIVGFTVADRWGYKKNSEGYKEAQRIFASKYSFITLEQFRDEIVLAWCAESSNNKSEKMKMAKVLGEGETNEEERAIFNKVSNKVKEQSKENLLTGIPNEVIAKKEVNTDLIKIIDGGFEKVIQAAKDKNYNFKFKDEECSNILLALESLNNMKHECNLDDIDNDDFLESVLKIHNKRIVEAEIPLRNYNEQMLLEIKANFNAKINGIPAIKKNTNSRNRTKETIFDKIDYGKISDVSGNDFLVGYDELIEFYDVIDKKVNCIDELVKFYNIESKYNLLFYIAIVIDLFEDTTLGKKELAKQISKLALLDCCIHRSSNMRLTVNRLIYAFNKESNTYQQVCDEINEVTMLKNRIVKDLQEVGSLIYENLKEEAFNIISVNAKNEIASQIKKVNVIDYLGFQNDKKMIQKIVKNLKYLIENNKEILLERSRLKNNI